MFYKINLTKVFLLFVSLITVFAAHQISDTAKTGAEAVGGESFPTDTFEKFSKNQVDLSKLGLSFVPNRGQFPLEVKYSSQATGHDLFFLPDTVIFNLISINTEKNANEKVEALPGKAGVGLPKFSNSVIKMNFIGSNKKTDISGEAEKEGKVNILKGDDPAAWQRNLPTYETIRYREVYPGIDLIFYGTEGKIQYDFIVSPKANPDKIKFSIEGAEKIKKDSVGNLILSVEKKDVGLSRPVLYQTDKNNTRVEIAGEFQINKDKTVSFKIGEYDRTKTLVIDPILTYSSFLGGTLDDVGNSVAVDNQGNTYITGSTRSNDFPVSPDGNTPVFNEMDAFITKLNPQGTDFVYSTIVGSSGGEDIGYDLKVDPSNQVYVVGKSGNNRFPQQKPLNYHSSVYTTAENSNNWQRRRGINVTINRIAPNPVDSAAALAGTNAGIYKTTDSGSTWVSVNSSFGTTLPGVTAITYHPTNPLIALAAGARATGVYPNFERIYKSGDGGETWTGINASVGTNPIDCITYDPVNPQNVYLCGYNKIYKSTNGGETWFLSSSGLNAGRIHETLVDPNNPLIIYAATSDGMFKSTDGGANWLAINNGILGNSLDVIATVAFDPNNSSTIYAGTFARIYKSVNGGANWDSHPTSLPFAFMSSLIIHPANPSVMYVAIRFSGIWQTTDGGNTWSNFSQGIVNPNVLTAVLSADGQTLLSGTESTPTPGGFVLKLNAAGDDLIYSTLFGWYNYSVAIDNSGRAHVGGYAPSDGWIQLVNPLRNYTQREEGYIAVLDSTGENIVFSTYIGGTENDKINDIALDPGGNIYAAGTTNSPDFPVINAFQASLSGHSDAFVAKLSPNGAGFIYSTYFGTIGVDEGFAITADPQSNAYLAGNAGNVLPNSITPPIQTFGGGVDAFLAKLNPSGSSLLFATHIGGNEIDGSNDVAVNQNGEIFVAGQSQSVDFPAFRSIKSKNPFTKSSDRGDTWRNDVEGLPVNQVNTIAIYPGDTNIILAGTNKGVFRSLDGGVNWTRSNSGINTNNIQEIIFDPSNPTIFYAGTMPDSPGVGIGGVYKSSNGGQTWTEINNGIATSHRQVFALAVDPFNSNIVYAGTDGFNPGYPIYKSTNAGASWSVISTSVVNIGDIEIDPTNSSIIYAVSTNLPEAAFRSQNGGLSWQNISQGISSFSRAYSIEIDRTNPSTLYIGADGAVYKSTNSGASWTASLPLPNVFARVTIDPVNTSTVYAGTLQGLFISNNGGGSWENKNDGLIYKSIGVVAVDPGNPGVVYASARAESEYDAFVTKINSSGTAVEYSALFGSSGELNTFPLDYAHSIALSNDGGVYSTGYTRVHNFPTTVGAFSQHFSGNFEAFLTRLDSSWKILGRIKYSNNLPVDGVSMELTGTNNEIAATELDGKYRFNQARSGGNFILIPRKVGYSFSPAHQVINNLSNDLTLDFTAVESTVTISGQITDGASAGLSGITVSLSGSQSQTVQTNSGGFYSFVVPRDGNFMVKPTGNGYIFSPQSLSFNNLVSNQQANFVASAGYLITGQITLSGIGLSSIPVNLSGSQESISVLTDSSGNFEFSAPAGGNYTVAPSVHLYAFSPPFVVINNLNNPQNLQFTASLATEKTNGKIAFVSNAFVNNVANFDIFTYTPEGKINLSNNQAGEINPVWSPNGRKLAFSSNRDDNWEIYIMNADGSNQLRVTNDPAIDNEPSWSPDGNKLVFVRTPFGSSSAEIFTIEPNGANLTRLTENSWFESSPVWSPDGNEIAFVSEQDGNSEIYLMLKDVTNRRRLTLNNVANSNPAWSPDGSKIAFDEGTGANKEIFVMQRNGANPVRITNNTVEDTFPTWSPDSEKLSFSSTFQCSTLHLFMMNLDGTGRTALTNCGTLDTEPNWQTEPGAENTAPIDFDGDSKTDISIFRPSAGEWWYLRSSDGGNRAFQFGASFDNVVAADYTGDGKTDIAIWRPSSGVWFVLRSEDNSFYSFPFGTSGDIPTPSDFDGDGTADVAIFRPSTATWFIIRSSDGGTTITTFGADGDQPVAADYDGDGFADIAVFRPSDGSWWINRSSAGLLVTNFGTSSDNTVQADYTGDGKTDVAIWRPSTGEWFILRSEDLSFYSVPFGTSGDIAAPGDYDGDGAADYAVFRPSNATWYVQQSTNGFAAVGFGATGDQPVPNAFVR